MYYHNIAHINNDICNFGGILLININPNQIRCVLEIAKEGSVSKAADKMYMGQPNLSRILKDFEEKLGFEIFTRMPKGVTLTAKGARLLNYCQSILRALEKMEQLRIPEYAFLESCFLYIPHSAYYTQALAVFVHQQCFLYPVEIHFKECTSTEAFRHLSDGSTSLAIISHSAICHPYQFDPILAEKLQMTELRQYYYLITMNAANPLAASETLSLEHLSQCTQILYDDVQLLFREDSDLSQLTTIVSNNCSIVVNDRGSALDLLEKLPASYMWCPPLPDNYLEKHSLVQRPCFAPFMECRDTLVTLPENELSYVEKELVSFLKNWSQQTVLTN